MEKYVPEAERNIEPTTLHHAGQRAQHTTDWATPAPGMAYQEAGNYLEQDNIRQAIVEQDNTYKSVEYLLKQFKVLEKPSRLQNVPATG